MTLSELNTPQLIFLKVIGKGIFVKYAGRNTSAVFDSYEALYGQQSVI